MITKNKIEFEEIESYLLFVSGIESSFFIRKTDKLSSEEKAVKIKFVYEGKVTELYGITMNDIKSLRDDLDEFIEEVGIV